MMYLHAIVQMHVLHNFADNCFLFHCLLSVGVESIGMSLKLETVSSVFGKDN